MPAEWGDWNGGVGIQSLRPIPHCGIVLFEHDWFGGATSRLFGNFVKKLMAKYAGRAAHLTSNTTSFSSFEKVSSMIVVTGTWRIFSGQDFNGRSVSTPLQLLRATLSKQLSLLKKDMRSLRRQCLLACCFYFTIEKINFVHSSMSTQVEVIVDVDIIARQWTGEVWVTWWTHWSWKICKVVKKRKRRKNMIQIEDAPDHITSLFIGFNRLCRVAGSTRGQIFSLMWFFLLRTCPQVKNELQLS